MSGVVKTPQCIKTCSKCDPYEALRSNGGGGDEED
jgi:hypothetical protein